MEIVKELKKLGEIDETITWILIEGKNTIEMGRINKGKPNRHSRSNFSNSFLKSDTKKAYERECIKIYKRPMKKHILLEWMELA